MLEESGKPCSTTALTPQLPEAEASGHHPTGTAAPQRPLKHSWVERSALTRRHVLLADHTFPAFKSWFSSVS